MDFRLAIEASDVGVWTWDLATDGGTWSPEFYRRFGVVEGSLEPTGALFFQLVHPDDRERVEAEVRAAIAAHTLFECEFRVVRPRGDLFWAASRGRASYDAGGRPLRMTGTLTDITAQKQVEEALRESEERLRLAAEAAGFGTYDASITSRRVYWSPQMRAILGVPPDMDPDQSFSGVPPFVHPDDRERVEALMLATMEPGLPEAFEDEHRILRPSGEVRWVAVKGKTIFAGEGPARRPVRISGVLVDVTERRAAEEAVKAADRRKDEFLAILAHELRNPLAPLRNGLEILRRTSGGAQVEVREMMERQLSHMVRIVDDLLDVTRISSGKVTLQREPVALQAAASLAIEANRPLVDAARHTLVVDLPDAPVWIDADLTRIAQVIGNLLTNAAKYTPEGGHLGLSVHREGDLAVVRVTDDGLGIPGEMLDQVFAMFAQVRRSPARSQGGLGIGLSLVKSLVEMHGGTIVAESDGPGRGSTFTLRLPALRHEPAPAAERAADAREEAPKAAPLRILVVDDNRDGAESLSTLLKLGGDTLRTAFSGPEALAAARAFRPEVVFLDIGLPGLDGYEVARRIRADPAFGRPLLVALTGWGTEDDKRKARAAGFDDHLTKPVELAAVEAVIARAGLRAGPPLATMPPP